MVSRVNLLSKAAGETQTYVFDFTSRLSIGETLLTAAVAATVWSGDDPLPSAIISGSASIAGPKVSQKVTAGVTGTVYDLVCTVTTSAGQTLQLAGYLAIVTEVV